MCKSSMINTSWLTVNRSCQLRCRWCYAKDRGYDSKNDMDISMALQLINVVKGLGSQTCKILGGEPSIYPHIIQVLNRLRFLQIRSVIITNGLRYADKGFMREHFDAGLDSLVISMKAGTKESYKRLTGVDVLGRVYRAIGNLSDFRGGVTITIAEEIKEEIIPAIRGVVHAGARFVNLHFCSPTIVSGSPENHSMLTPDKAAEIMTTAVNYMERLNISYNVQISIPFCLFHPDLIQNLINKNCLTSGCIVNKQSGIIFGTKGEAGFCNHMMEYPFGQYGIDFSNADQLQLLYFGQEQFFEATNRVPSKKCLECSISHLCCGGCPLQWTQFQPYEYVKGGDKFKGFEHELN